MFEGMIVVSWTCPADDEKTKDLIREEAKKLEKASMEVRQADAGKADAASFVFHDGRIRGGEQAKLGWTLLFGEALTHWKIAGRDKT